MFCPKCGAQAADSAAFCAKCGNKFERVASAAGGTGGTGVGAKAQSVAGAASTPTATVVSAPLSTSLKVAPVGIVSIILLVIAFIFTFMSWYEVSYQLQSMAGMGSGLSGLASLLGGSGGSSMSGTLEGSYTLWNLFGLADFFNELMKSYSAYADSGSKSMVALITGFAWTSFILCIVSLALAVWGILAAFLKGSLAPLRAAGISLIVTVAVFYLFVAMMGHSSGEATMMPIACLIFAIASFACSLGALKKA